MYVVITEHGKEVLDQLVVAHLAELRRINTQLSPLFQSLQEPGKD